MICCLHAYVVGVNFHKLKFKIVNLDRNGRSGNSGMGSWSPGLLAPTFTRCQPCCLYNKQCVQWSNWMSHSAACKSFWSIHFFLFSFLLCRNLFTNLLISLPWAIQYNTSISLCTISFFPTSKFLRLRVARSLRVNYITYFSVPNYR